MTAPGVPSPPSPFPAIAVHIMPGGTVLHRTHAADFGAAAFNPCRGQPTRFAPFADAADACVPTLYAATTREAAAFESIFHDIAPAAPFKTVRLGAVTSRQVSRLAPRRDLRLARLFAPDLKAWGVSRIDLIETSKATYPQTARWAQAIHRARTDIDGLIWTSRQCDPDLCVVLFGDRVGEAELDVRDCITIGTDAGLLLEIRAFGRRAGITLVS